MVIDWHMSVIMPVSRTTAFAALYSALLSRFISMSFSALWESWLQFCGSNSRARATSDSILSLSRSAWESSEDNDFRSQSCSLLTGTCSLNGGH